MTTFLFCVALFSGADDPDSLSCIQVTTDRNALIAWLVPMLTATGCYSPSFIVCKACTLQACAWIQSWTAGKGKRKGPSFYGSIKS